MLAQAFTPSNMTTESWAAWQASQDSNSAALAWVGSWFQPTLTGADMNVHVGAGSLVVPSGTVAQAAQTVTLGTAPTANSRIDLVVINRLTAVASVIAGTVAASPVAPACPATCLPISTHLVGANVTAITGAVSTDVRIPGGGGGGMGTESTLTGNITLTAAQTGNNFVCTSALTATLPLSTGLATSWVNTVWAAGGNVTVTPNAADAIAIAGQTLAVGVSATVPKGFYGIITTDGAGGIKIELLAANMSLGIVASAATTDLGAVGSPVIQMTLGTGPVTGFGTSAIAGEEITVIFAAGITLTNSSGLILPGGANITTSANDVGKFARTSSGWICTSYQTASGAPLTGSLSVPVRQCVLAGDVDSNNKGNFLSLGSGLTPAFTVNSGQLLLAFANGFGAGGAVDLVTRLTAAGSLSAVQANATSFLYATYSSGSAVTWGSTLVPPQYGQVFDPQGYGLYHMENVGTDDYGNTAASNIGGSYSNVQAKFGTYSWKASGSGTYLVLNGHNPKQPWTAEGWIYVTTTGVAQTILALGLTSGADNSGYESSIGINSSNKTLVYLSADTWQGGGSTIANGVTGSVTWTTGWHHFAVSWDGSTYRGFVDGALDWSVSSTLPVGYPSVSSGGTPCVTLNGRNYTNNTGSSNYFDEWRISPCARYVAAFSTPTTVFTADGDFFNIATMQMASITGAGPAFTPVQRLYVGECVAGAASITSITSYALQRRYTTAFVAGLPSAGTAVSIAHNLGCSLHKVRAEIKNLAEITGNALNAVGTIAPWLTNGGSMIEPMGDVLSRSRNADVGYTGNNNSAVYQAAGGSISAATPGNWAYRFIFEGF